MVCLWLKFGFLGKKKHSKPSLPLAVCRAIVPEGRTRHFLPRQPSHPAEVSSRVQSGHHSPNGSPRDASNPFGYRGPWKWHHFPQLCFPLRAQRGNGSAGSSAFCGGTFAVLLPCSPRICGMACQRAQLAHPSAFSASESSVNLNCSTHPSSCPQQPSSGPHIHRRQERD